MQKRRSCRSTWCCAIVCVSAAVAGEMLQDLKAGHILGGTPWKMQIGDISGVVIAGAVMFFVLNWLNQADIAQGIGLMVMMVDSEVKNLLLLRLV